MSDLDLLLQRHERLLWILPAAERNRIMAELRLDYLFEAVQRCVSEEMANG